MIANWLIPDALTEQASDLHAIWWTFIFIGLGVALIVYGLLAFAIIRYRRRDDELPAQLHNRIGIELTYTIIPLLLVGGLIAITLSGIDDTEATAADPDVTVHVTGSQWTWDFEYEGTDVNVTGTGDLNDIPQLVLPVEATVRFNLTSDDVIHSFWLPGFFYKRDLIPGQVQSFDVDMGDQTGTWWGQCAEYCGLNHYAMRFSVRIVTPDEFERWQAEQ